MERFLSATRELRPQKLQDLKAAAKELHELSLGVGRAIDSAAETGELPKAQDVFAELEARTKEYDKLREKLGPAGIFLAKFNVEVHGPHEVSFVLPKGISRSDMLQEAQSLLIEDRKLIYPDRLTEWQQDPTFAAVATTTNRIHIDGHVEGGDAKSRAEQEAFLRVQGLQMPSKEDLAVAFVAHYVATKEPLFNFYKNNTYTYVVRAAGGALSFYSNGLYEVDIRDDARDAFVAVAAALPPLRQGYVGQAGIKK